MKQYQLTTQDLNQTNNDDCYLAPDDPIHELKALAGLGGEARSHEYRASLGSNVSVTGNNNGEIMRKNNIKPGTPEWFKLWFSLPYMTGEKKL